MPLQATKKNSAKLNVMNTEISVVVGSDEVIFTNLRKKQTKTKRKTKRKYSYWAVQLKLQYSVAEAKSTLFKKFNSCLRWIRKLVRKFGDEFE